MTDAAIHRVSRKANDLSLRLLVHSGSPRAFALAMTTHTLVIARRERSERRGNPSYLEGDDPVSLFAYWFTVDRHGLTPSR